MADTPRQLGPLRTVVVKIGSRIVLSMDMDRLVDDIQAVRARGISVVLVSSGAVALGMRALGVDQRPGELPVAQALAAVGQSQLMNRYASSFARHGRCCAQILLTHEDLSDRVHFLNIRQTIAETLGLGVIPIINENDTVATEELRFGDNDRLAAAVGVVVDADLVILLSDVDAVYEVDPRVEPDARPIREVDVIDQQIESAAGSAGSGIGTGGMLSKIQAARLAVDAEIPLILAHGLESSVVQRVVAGEPVGTWFKPSKRRLGLRRHWIGFLSKIKGTLRVDEGAARALRERGSSLLPAGVVGFEGHFVRGDAVTVVDEAGAELARGVVGYDADQLGRILGRHTDEAARILRVEAADPVVHRNNMVVLRGSEPGREA